MENIENAEAKQVILKSVDEIMDRLKVAVPSELTKPQVIAVLQLFVELYV